MKYQKLYSYTAVQNLINEINEDDYCDIFTIRDGGLLDSIVIISEKYGCYKCDEVYLNEWSSAYKVTKRRDLPKSWDKLIIKYENEHYEE